MSSYDTRLLPLEREEYLEVSCECGHTFMAKCYTIEGGSVEFLEPDRCPECGSQDGGECSEPDPPEKDYDTWREEQADKDGHW